MSEVLLWPGEKPISVISSYFEAVPRISADDYSFSGRVTDTVMSVQQIESTAAIADKIDEELLRTILDLPVDIVRGARENELDISDLTNLTYHFAVNTGKFVGQITADVTAAHHENEKLHLLRQGYLAAQFLGEHYSDPRKHAHYTAEAGFRYTVATKLDLAVGKSVYQACNLTSSTIDDALDRARFLAKAGEWGFLSPDKYKLLKAAWTTTQLEEPLAPEPIDPLHKPEN